MISRISDYSQKWGEFSDFFSEDLLSLPWDMVVAVPACREYELLPRLLDSILKTKDKKIAVVIVVNNTVDASADAFTENRKTIDLLCKNTKKEWTHGVVWSTWGGIDLFVIDRSSPHLALPSKQGVGLARKISCDFALLIKSYSPWIRTTDADAILPEDYWQDPNLPSKTAAWRWPYLHIRTGEKHQDRAIHLYEIFLRLWEEGLKFAGSPYAWQAMGSCLGFSKEFYAAVRGYPLRQAGEDFYILNKLQKIGTIVSLTGVEPIALESRLSDRVPFGTGAAMQNLLETMQNQEVYQVYHPKIFVLLKQFLKAAENAIESENVHNWDEDFSSAIRSIHADMKIQDALLRSIKNGGKNQVAQFHVWFDGFRTMKWMHHIRDNVLGSVGIEHYLLDPTEVVPQTKCFKSVFEEHL